MTNLDSRLVQVVEHYDKVFAAYQSGQLSADQATTMVSQAVVTDAAGNQWGLNAQKVWQKTTPAGEKVEGANPEDFVTAQPVFPTMPTGGAAFGDGAPQMSSERVFPVNPVADNTFTTFHDTPPPPTSLHSPTDSSSFTGTPVWEDNPMRAGGDEPRYMDDDYAPKKKRREKKPKPAKSGPNVSLGDRLGGLMSLRDRIPLSNRTLLVIVGAAVLVLVAFLVRQPSAPTDGVNPNTAVPPAVSQPADTPSPTDADQNRVVELLRVGNFSEAVSGPDLGPALSQSAWAGAKTTQMVVELGPFESDTVQAWTVKDREGNPVKQMSVQWDNSTGVWKLSALPNLLP